MQALQAPRRREILRLVWTEEQSAGAIREHFGDVTFGAVSQHLGTLAEAGLVSRRKVGRRVFYLANRRELGSLGEWLESEWGSALYRLKLLAELEEARRGPRSVSITNSTGPVPAPGAQQEARGGSNVTL